MTTQTEVIWAMMPALPWTSLKEEEKALVAHTVDLIKKDAEKAVLDRLTTLAADKDFLSIEEITDALETKR